VCIFLQISSQIVELIIQFLMQICFYSIRIFSVLMNMITAVINKQNHKIRKILEQF